MAQFFKYSLYNETYVFIQLSLYKADLKSIVWKNSTEDKEQNLKKLLF